MSGNHAVDRTTTVGSTTVVASTQAAAPDAGVVPGGSPVNPRTRSVPPKVTADTGMDVITHGLEAYVSTKASDFTDAFVEKALDLAFANLPRAYAEGKDLRAREAMHHASCMAGIAFNAAGLGLVHALAHAIGGALHISHGRINAMLLPRVIEFNAGLFPSSIASEASCHVTADRYAAIGRRLGIESRTVQGGARNLARAISALNARLSIPPTLKILGSDMGEYMRREDELVHTALADACLATNPVHPAPEDVRALIRAVAGCE